MLDVADSAVILDVNVEAVWAEVLGHDGARGDDATLLGEVLLAEVLF